MKIQCLAAMLPVAFLSPAACHRPATASCVKVEVTYKGANAEYIAGAFVGVAPTMDLAVFDDGHAAVYFDEELPEVIAILAENKGQAPRDMIVGAPMIMPGGIPTPPTQVEVKQLRLTIDRDRAVAEGLTAGDVGKALEGLALEATDENRAAWEAAKVHKPDGTQIPITTLGKIEVETVKRPLIKLPEVVGK